MCNTLGALLAKQLTVQVFTRAYLTAVDILHFILIFFPVCKWETSTSGGSRKKLKKSRRKRNVFAVTLPLAVGSGYYISKNTFQSKLFENDFHRTGRRLLTTFLQILLLLCCMKPSASRQTDLERTRGADTEALLAQSVLGVGEEEEEEEEELHVKSNKKAEVRRRVPFGAIRLPGEGEVSPTEISKDPEPPTYPPLKVIRAALSSFSSYSGSVHDLRARGTRA
ncbi:UNVERIFIED_CONTAM: hypothetical protein FKN15_011809 [Acipenser sinensis]